MSESNQIEQLLTEIRDLLAGHEKRYAEYPDRVEEAAKTNKQNYSQYLAQADQSYKLHLEDVRLERKRGRVQLFILALVIGILLWAFMLYVIITVQ